VRLHPATLLLVLAEAAAAEPPATLADCYAAALERSDTLAVESERLRQAEARIRQARGAALPTLAMTGAYLVQQASGEDPLRRAFAPTTQPSARVTVTQPLFRGFREFAALRTARHLRDAQAAARRWAEILLYEDVVAAFHETLAAEHEVASLEAQTGVYDRLVADLERRAATGRSREGEVLAARAARARTAAQLAAARGREAAARETLRFLTGFGPDRVLATPAGDPAPLGGLADYLAGAAGRPDVTAAEARREAAGEDVAVARGARWPALDLVGNYHLVRSGFLEDIRWDAQVALTVPIFNGGVTGARVLEAESRHRESGREAERVRRGAELEIRTAYAQAAAAEREVEALRAAAAAAAASETRQRAEYDLGLVSNLAVLEAVAGRLEAERALVRAELGLRAARLRLDAAAGRAP
jgi:outer membrane protein